MKWFNVLLIAALVEVGCVANPETGEHEFAPVEAVKVAVAKVREIPDETKASILESLAWLLGATGVGGGVVVLAQRGASYYRNKAASKTPIVSDDENAQDDGKV